MKKVIFDNNGYTITSYKIFQNYSEREIINNLLIVDINNDEYRIVSFYTKENVRAMALVNLKTQLLSTYSENFDCLEDYIKNLTEMNYTVYFKEQ